MPKTESVEQIHKAITVLAASTDPLAPGIARVLATGVSWVNHYTDSADVCLSECPRCALFGLADQVTA